MELQAGDQAGNNADWWWVASTPWGWCHYQVGSNSWVPGLTVSYQGTASDLSATDSLNGLPVGSYTFYFGIDMIMNGSVDLGGIYYDSVDVQVSEIVTVISASQVWMDRNLGASRVATSFDDEEAYGDLYQWGRGTDGHEKRTSSTTSTLSTSDDPGHGDFIIITTSSYPYDWRSPQNDELWQGESGTNNPCPAGFRLPTETELEIERLSWVSNNSAGAFDSPLKHVAAGHRANYNGTVYNAGSSGYCWSSTVNGSLARHLLIFSDNAGMSNNLRADGFSARCLED